MAPIVLLANWQVLSRDTTFYILALYFGSVGIKKVRYAIWAGMIADFFGVLAAIGIAYIMLR